MEKEEILEVIEIQLQEMNKVSGKGVAQRFREIRTVVNMLAKLVLEKENVEITKHYENPSDLYKQKK